MWKNTQVYYTGHLSILYSIEGERLPNSSKILGFTWEPIEQNTKNRLRLNQQKSLWVWGGPCVFTLACARPQAQTSCVVQMDPMPIPPMDTVEKMKKKTKQRTPKNVWGSGFQPRFVYREFLPIHFYGELVHCFLFVNRSQMIPNHVVLLLELEALLAILNHISDGRMATVGSCVSKLRAIQNPGSSGDFA